MSSPLADAAPPTPGRRRHERRKKVLRKGVDVFVVETGDEELQGYQNDDDPYRNHVLFKRMLDYLVL
ncbi:hypothetical protein ZIOFF_073748 [Zingiber officinale]|uniref:Uncharacterized protein n=1 Tax=Zingiber officinale TaxID=94328 RepID=A0A8J5EAG9_ZINOF|nr:hypothetical protein ZIOFF_073748 [Zingiber officinale]